MLLAVTFFVLVAICKAFSPDIVAEFFLFFKFIIIVISLPKNWNLEIFFFKEIVNHKK